MRWNKGQIERSYLDVFFVVIGFSFIYRFHFYVISTLSVVAYKFPQNLTYYIFLLSVILRDKYWFLTKV